jgi:hypothetical protein
MPHTEQVANWKFDRLQASLVQPKDRLLTSEEVRCKGDCDMVTRTWDQLLLYVLAR